MSDDINNIFNDLKKMIDNGNLPNNIQDIVNNLQNDSKNDTISNNEKATNTSNSDSNKISPELINTLSNFINSNQNNSANENTNEQSNSSIDINTILRMKTIIDSMNKKDDPRANLLYSLKPYLRENRKTKLDQYVNLLKMTNIADVLKNDKKENSSNA